MATRTTRTHRHRKTRAPLADVLSYRNARVIRGFLHVYDVDPAEARLLFREMLKLLWLASVRDSGFAIWANWKPLDDMWHSFILHTEDYEAFCHRYFGRMIHHRPETRARTKPMSARRFEREVNAAVDRVWAELGPKTCDLWFRKFWRRYTPKFLDKHIRRPSRISRPEATERATATSSPELRGTYPRPYPRRLRPRSR